MRRRPRPSARAATTSTVTAFVLAATAAGCGVSQAPVQNLTVPAAPTGTLTLSYPAAGVSLNVPANWSVADDQVAPIVTVVSSGPATIALWDYAPASSAADGGLHSTAVTSDIPAGDTSALTAARTRLLAAIRRRDPGFTLLKSAFTAIDGYGAIELDAIERVDGQLRRTRNEHVYGPQGEIVLDEYAPVSQFARADHLVFSPVRRSLTLLSGASSSSSATTTTATNTTDTALATETDGTTATTTGATGVSATSVGATP